MSELTPFVVQMKLKKIFLIVVTAAISVFMLVLTGLHNYQTTTAQLFNKSSKPLTLHACIVDDVKHCAPGSFPLTVQPGGKVFFDLPTSIRIGSHSLLLQASMHSGDSQKIGMQCSFQKQNNHCFLEIAMRDREMVCSTCTD